MDWRATSHETRNARPDLLLAKNVRRQDTSQSFVGTRAKIKPRKETFVMSPRTTTLHLKFTGLGATHIPTVALEGYNCRVCSLIQNPLAVSLTGRRGRCSKKKEIKCKSWKSHMKLYSYGSEEEPLNPAGEFETEL